MSEIQYNIVKIGLISGGIVLFLILELIIPYRENSVSKFRRWLNNLGLGIVNITIIQIFFVSLIISISIYNSNKQIGLLNLMQIPDWLKIIDTIIIMDLVMYFWHIMTHRVPLLWRFHRVHHTDLDVDVSTTLRYHIGEVIPQFLILAGVVYFIGADPIGVLAFECIFLLANLFRHSRFKLSSGFENIFWILFVPPAMHRIHHSVDLEERNTNFGTIFSIWDRFFGTLLTGINQNQIWTGVDGHIQEKKLEIYHLIWMPFTPAVK
jgi:sterol desaturase/sphingolipid hydroxylase (fatty acid hydroxylase superfamily)